MDLHESQLTIVPFIHSQRSHKAQMHAKTTMLSAAVDAKEDSLQRNPFGNQRMRGHVQ
jgi:hypothetical protein